MTDDVLTRDYDLHDVDVSGDGRTLTLACVPFDRPATVDDGAGPYREQWKRGAFAHIVRAANRVELRYWHRNESLPYGFGQSLREDASYLVGDFRVAKGAQGDQLLALVDDGLKGVSIGFIEDPAGSVRTRDLVTRTRVKRLVEVSMTPAPSHAGAELLAVRSTDELANRAAMIEREKHFWQMARMGRPESN